MPAAGDFFLDFQHIVASNAHFFFWRLRRQMSLLPPPPLPSPDRLPPADVANGSVVGIVFRYT